MDSPPPPPLTPAHIDLRDFGWMPIDVRPLLEGTLVSERDPEIFRVAVVSWCVAWHQLPAGSLPDDDLTLARLLGFGRDVKAWKRLRAAGGLRDWILCDDGRLYHPQVAAEAIKAWAVKTARKNNRGKTRERVSRLRRSRTTTEGEQHQDQDQQSQAEAEAENAICNALRNPHDHLGNALRNAPGNAPVHRYPVRPGPGPDQDPYQTGTQTRPDPDQTRPPSSPSPAPPDPRPDPDRTPTPPTGPRPDQTTRTGPLTAPDLGTMSGPLGRPDLQDSPTTATPEPRAREPVADSPAPTSGTPARPGSPGVLAQPDGDSDSPLSRRVRGIHPEAIRLAVNAGDVICLAGACGATDVPKHRLEWLADTHDMRMGEIAAILIWRIWQKDRVRLPSGFRVAKAAWFDLTAESRRQFVIDLMPQMGIQLPPKFFPQEVA